MPASKDYSSLRGFEQHGVQFTENTETQAIGFCPFCGHPKKFYANITTRLWDCKVCGRSGNFEHFLALRSVDYQSSFKGVAASRLALNRKIRPQVLKAWGVGWSDSFYTIPSTGNPKGMLSDLRRYTLGGRSLATSGTHPSFIVPLQQYDSDRIWLCEGEWDAMALWGVLAQLGIKDNVWAVPGANVFPLKLSEMFYDKEVYIVFDNDDAGARGMRKIQIRLATIARSVRFINWPEGLPDKADVRDFYLANDRDPKRTLDGILGFLQQNPPTDIIQAAKDAAVCPIEEPGDGKGLEPAVVEMRFQKWLYMASTEPLDVIFGTVYANQIAGDPLWLFLVAPSGGAKSAYLSQFAGIPGKAICITSLTPKALVSGFILPGGGDPSLLPALHGKMLVIKDFTCILAMNAPQRDEIFGVLRDAYDGSLAKPFGSGLIRRYESHFGILAGVTPAIESVHGTNSPLGERFLKYRIRYGGNVETGREAIRRALENIGKAVEMSADLKEVTHTVLRRKIMEDEWPDVPEYIRGRIIQLAQWVAKLRGAVSRERYTAKITHKPHTEIATRLASQLAKLAIGISAYRREKRVSERTYRTIVSVAQDTAPDTVEEVVKQLYIRDHEKFFTRDELSKWSKFPTDTLHYMLEDMVLLGICEVGVERRGTYRLHPRLVRVMSNLHLYWRERSWLQGISARIGSVKRRVK